MGDEINKTKLVVGIIVTIIGGVLLTLYAIYGVRFTYNAVHLQVYVGFSDGAVFEAINTLYLYQILSIVTLIVGGSLLFSSWK